VRMAMSRILVKPHRVDKSKIDDNSSNECSANALKFLSQKMERSITQLQLMFDGQSTHRGYRTDRNASKSLDFTFSREMTGRDEPSGAGSRERRVMKIFESRQKKYDGRDTGLPST